jgi:hypothetical protein
MNVYFEFDNGGRFVARPDTLGTSAEELILLDGMPPTPARESRLASLQANVRHAYETLLTTETAGRG